jgi:dolichyl-phosphate beta-glucosyltransferase
MDLSVVVPVYNEEARLKPFLTDLEKFMGGNAGCEIVFVNDGSNDGSLAILKEFSKSHRSAKIVSYDKNRGKGYAVKTGVFAAAGKKIIFIDADCSTSPAEIKNMLPMLDNFDVVAGDRTHYESDVKQPFLRRTTGKLFNFWANTFFGINVKDNLCGFKGFRSNVARDLFKNLASDRWIFDVEIFYKARKKHYSLAQMSIKWVHRDGTKIRMFDPFKMFVQLISLRLRLIGK